MGCDALYDARLAISGKDVALFDLATWKNGLAFKKIDFSDSGIPVIKIAELNNGIGSSTSFTRGVYSSDVKLQRGDFLFSWSGNPETSIDIFRFELEEGWLNQHIFKTTPNSSLVTWDYFFYLMKWLKPVFKSIASNKQTTGLGHITISDLKKIKVTVPAKDFQDKVAAILTAIDNKISLNAKLNGYLDEYIDATLRNMLNQQEGAEVSLGDYLYIKGRIGWKGLKKSEYLSDSNYRIINGESLTMSGIDWNKAGYISKERYDESPEIMLEIGDILLSKDGTIGKIGYVDELERPTTVASGIFVIRNLRKDVLSTHFVYYLLKSRLFKAFIASRTEGSVIPHLYQKDFVEFLFPLPPIDVMKKFDKLTGPMFQQTIVNAHENKRLAELRDALLPKLMSGEIDVSKIDLTQLNSHLA